MGINTTTNAESFCLSHVHVSEGSRRLEIRKITQSQLLETTYRSERIWVGRNGWVEPASPGPVRPARWLAGSMVMAGSLGAGVRAWPHSLRLLFIYLFLIRVYC